MHSHFLTTTAVVLLGASAMAQRDIHSRLQPVTAPIRHLGVYHVATGTWTRNSTLANVTGPDAIYNNSCAPAYFGRQVTGEKWQHRSRVPSPTGPRTPSVFYYTERDEAPGCQTSYTVNGFRIAYCSDLIGGGITYVYEFANSYALCGGGDMVPDYTFTVTGLPGGTAAGSELCWSVDMDVSATTPAFVLSGDQDGTWTGPSSSEQFGFSQGPTAPANVGTGTGPIIAGDVTWTGGTFTGPLTPCTGTDGTIWDSPINLAEQGTGMSSNDFFRISGATLVPGGPGCYFFGGNPHADFYLKLFAVANCPPPGIKFCEPGVNGVIACPCVNPPSGLGRGCDNSSGTGGATMIDIGGASLAWDSVVFTTTDETPTAMSIVLQGDAEVTTGIAFGDGVRGAGGLLKRLYLKTARSGSITAPAVADQSVHFRSATLGDPILPGSTRYYQVYYRDTSIFGCTLLPGGSNFNISVGRTILWNP